MLVHQNGGAAFSVGKSRFTDRAPGSEEPTPKIFIRIQPEALGGVIFAQLDTAAAWTIFDASVAEALSLLDGTGDLIPLSTRKGQFRGRLARTPLDIVADEGESLTVEATVWVCPDWTHGTFLGYAGLLERIRFALDPSNDFFYFGPI